MAKGSLRALLVGLALIGCLNFLLLEQEVSAWSNPLSKIYQKGINLRDRMVNVVHRRINGGVSSGTNNAQYMQRSSSQNQRILGRSVPPPTSVTEPMVSRADTTQTDTDNNDYNAKCFVDREPNLNKSPKLFFYSDKNHSKDTLGCKVLVEFSLNRTSPSKGNDDFDSEQQQQENIRNFKFDVQAKLINLGLYDAANPTFFLIHGFLSSWNKDTWMCNTKDLILNKSHANVFIVDWSGGAKPMLPIDYGAAVGNTKYVAQLLSAFISGLLAASGQASAERFHLIGHSLGAHISGFVGYSLAGRGSSLGRITGLDPAGPCFSSHSKGETVDASNNGLLERGQKRRLSPESANFVLALHTDTAMFGLNENCGHFDVYVNGGYRQPYCPSLSLKERFIDLLDLNINDSLSPNIVCAHSYSHSTLDTFLSPIRRLLRHHESEHKNREAENGIVAIQVTNTAEIFNHEPRCFAMAYHCSSWNAFKAGECGFCRDHDAHCIYTGLAVVDASVQPIRLAETNDRLIGEPLDDVPELSDDDKFNDEAGDEDEDTMSADDPGEVKPKNTEEDPLAPNDRNSRGQHYIKSGSGSPVCLYHYQIVLAARKSSLDAIKDAQKYYYYLDVPLEEVGLLVDDKDQRLHDRLVQISHKVKQNSRTHNFLKTIYTRETPMDGDDVEFYTALITFKQAPYDQCRNGDNDGATKSKKWQLCRPLYNIREARLWSSNEQKLNSVQWVGLNYMSATTYADRLSNSWIFERDFSEDLKSRKELDKVDRADMASLAPDQPKTVGNVVAKPVKCLLSFLDQSDEGKAATNFKCNRSAKELKFTIKLSAKKQQA